MEYKILKEDGLAKSAEVKTVHGTVQTPLFMNVATAGAIKGAVSAEDLEQIGTQVMLCNTYHLHVRPGDEVVRDMGGLRGFTTWQGPTLTDSGATELFHSGRGGHVGRALPIRLFH
ncbi:MAG: tRNA-guanine transglycosylase [Lachnospiraceae bacterium]|nr:tRNA-guanine transglycosylase [Lachnospiraceae bacterium]